MKPSLRMPNIILLVYARIELKIIKESHLIKPFGMSDLVSYSIYTKKSGGALKKNSFEHFGTGCVGEVCNSSMPISLI